MSIEFTHKHTLDPDWTPGPGQRYADAPKAKMRVTRMTTKRVYYTYADSPLGSQALSYMTRYVWDVDYADSLPQATTTGEG